MKNMPSDIVLINRLQWSGCLVPDSLDLGAQKAPMAKSIQVEHLIVSKVKSPLHATQAPFNWIISIATTRLATNKMRHEWPPFVA